MKTYQNPAQSQWSELTERPALESENLEATIADVFSQIQSGGDQALVDLTMKFDKVPISSVLVDPSDIENWAESVPEDLKQAIDAAHANITAFHTAQLGSLEMIRVETQPGVVCWRESRPIERVGLYIPGGSAPLFSTVLMLGVPAQIAGCKEVILCTPPQADESINAAICYAAKVAGITKVFRVGGAQAIAAMAVGTESVPKVDKVFGPGNQYVVAAKFFAGNFGVAIDMPAGPSEVMVIADESARPDFVAADLLSQAEHGPDSQVVLLTTDDRIAKQVDAEVERQLSLLPRKDIAAVALKNSLNIVFDDIDTAIDFANTYSPEHLILSIKDVEGKTSRVHNAGSVFLGNYTPESAGDYASGTNHTLPTNSWARSYSGLSLESFCKYVTFQSITEAGAKGLAHTVTTMAKAEGLDAHARAMDIRVEES
ncbi:MAG: histidinol dehydrogenase [Candidatus Microsaccharimonas sp.]